MRKLLLLVVIAILGISEKSIAQDVDFGIKAGLNVSNILGGDANRNNLIAFHVGAVSEFKLSEKFSIQPELIYTRHGSDTDAAKVKLDYLAIPIMAKFYVIDKLSLEIGPQLSFLLEDKAKFKDSSIPDADTNASNFDFLANIGAGYEINSNLFFQLRYNYGITTVNENPDLKNGVLQLSLGYKI